MDILCQLKVNDEVSGKYLASAGIIVTVDEYYDDMDDFDKEYGEEVQEYLENMIDDEIFENNRCFCRLSMVAFEEEDDKESD